MKARALSISTGSNSERLTRTDRLEKLLVSKIIVGSLAPGERLKAAELARRHGVSVTPVREVLGRLAEQGLVTIDPWVGARVSDMSPSDLNDLQSVRLILEREALRRSIEHGDSRWETTVTTAFNRLVRASRPPAADQRSMHHRRILMWLSAHQEFHLSVLSACGSPWTMRVLEMLYGQLARYQATEWGDAGPRASSLDEHRALFRAAIERDAQAAESALIAHLESQATWMRSASSSQHRHDGTI